MIKKAVYGRRRMLLVVWATSSNQPSAVLEVAGYGVMKWNSRKKIYTYAGSEVADPGGTVVVTSSLGGTATATVKYRR